MASRAKNYIFVATVKKKIPVYAMKVYTGSRGVDSSILNLGTRWR